MDLAASLHLAYARWWQRAKEWRPERVDAVLYLAAAIFAGGTALFSGLALYRQWGEMAVGPYVIAGIVSELHWHRVPRPHTGTWTRTRAAILLFVLIGAFLVPLALEVSWQSGGHGNAHAQPEVTVVEAAARRVSEGHDLYLAPAPGSKILPAPRGKPEYEAYFPYLPGMVSFGLPHATDAPAPITDARVAFTGLTLLVVMLALLAWPKRSEARIRALQVLTVLPTAALPLATGGDDLPVVALCLLGLVLLARRRPFLAGLVLGAAASLKFTAWPVVLLALFVARDRSDRRAIGRYVAAGSAVFLPVVLPSFLANPAAFVDNVVRFPLGLAGVSSPAGSPLPGHLLVTAFPDARHVLTAVLVGVGVLFLLRYLVLHRPRTASDVAMLSGWLMLAAILLAPATRFGYLLYPINFFVWAVMLHEPDASRGPVTAATSDEAVLAPAL